MASVLSADALTTLSNLKEMLNISSTDTSKDNQLERIINRATQWIERQTERKLKARKYNGGSSTHTTGVADEACIYFSGTKKDFGGDTVVDEYGYGIFYLPAWPIQADSVLTFPLAVLSDRGSDISGGETWDIDSLKEFDDYILDRDNGVLKYLWGEFENGQRNYRITCAAGFQTGSAQPYVPLDLEDLCIEVARQMYEGRGIQSESEGSVSRTLKADSDKWINATLSAYRRWSL